MRLPFFHGWIIIAVTFVTMVIGVNARTAFSLFYPLIISEFGWERGVTAGAFSFGFVVSGVVSPLIGHMMDPFWSACGDGAPRHGDRDRLCRRRRRFGDAAQGKCQRYFRTAQFRSPAADR
jgi:MFS family permease